MVIKLGQQASKGLLKEFGRKIQSKDMLVSLALSRQINHELLTHLSILQNHYILL
jgi:hypothetical protein